MINNLKQINKKSNYIFRKLSGDFYLIGNGACYKLNITGATVINALGKDIDIDEVCKRLSLKFAHSNIQEIRTDVDAFLQFLISEEIADYVES